MKSKCLLIISLLVFGRVGLSQITTQSGREYIKKLKNDDFLKTNFIKGSNGFIYQIDYQRRDEVVVHEYNENLELQRKVSSQPEQEYLRHRGLFKIGSEIFILRSVPMGVKEEVLSAFRFNKESLTFDKHIEIFRSDMAKYGTYYNFSYSQDSSLLLITKDQLKKDRALSKNEYSFAVLNEHGVLKWEEELENFSSEFTKEAYHDFQISNSGSFFLLSPNFNEDKKAKVHGYYYTYLIEEFILPEGEVERFEAKLDTGYFKRSKLKILPNDNISLCGFYSREGTYQSGVYYKEYRNQELHKNFAQCFQSKNILKYESQTKRENATQMELKGKDFKSPEFEIRQVNIDGKYPILIAEDAYSGTNASDVVYYKYGNILICRFDTSDAFNWHRVIAKKQYCKGLSLDYISYGLFIDPSGKLNFVFNDHAKNSSVEGISILTKWKANIKKADLILVSVDEKGFTSRNKLLSNENVSVVNKPSKLCQDRWNSAIVFGWNKKETKFFRIEAP